MSGLIHLYTGEYQAKIFIHMVVNVNGGIFFGNNFFISRIPVLQKQRNAFPPNFVHSLDSCHMILTGLHCEQSDITFVSVHDCYWVHAKNVTMMSKVKLCWSFITFEIRSNLGEVLQEMF